MHAFVAFNFNFVVFYVLCYTSGPNRVCRNCYITNYVAVTSIATAYFAMVVLFDDTYDVYVGRRLRTNSTKINRFQSKIIPSLVNTDFSPRCISEKSILFFKFQAGRSEWVSNPYL